MPLPSALNCRGDWRLIEYGDQSISAERMWYSGVSFGKRIAKVRAIDHRPEALTDNSSPYCVQNHFRNAVDVQFLHEVASMGVNRMRTEA